jgi:hypothetical protein
MMAVQNAVSCIPFFAGSFAIVDINDAAFGTVTTTQSDGRWYYTRTGAGGSTLYRGTTNLGSTSSGSNTPDSNIIFAFAENQSGTPSAFCTDQYAWLGIMDGCSGADITALDGIMAAYATAWGI